MAWSKVADMLGTGTFPDPARPNNEGGATPLYVQVATHDLLSEVDGPLAPELKNQFPLYRVFSVCPKEAFLDDGRRFRGCGKQHVAMSTRPQYDDDGLRRRGCEDCLKLVDADRIARWRGDRADKASERRGKKPLERAERAGSKGLDSLL